MFDSRDASCQFSFTENHFRSVTQALTMLQVFLLQNVNAQSRRENYQQSTFRTELREREAAVDLVTPEWLPWRYTFFKNLRFSSKHISTGWHIQTDTVYIYRERGRGSEREEECVTDRRRKRRIESAPQREREREKTHQHKNKINTVTIHRGHAVCVTSEPPVSKMSAALKMITLIILHLTLQW